MKHLPKTILQTSLLVSGFLLLNACGGRSTANTNTPTSTPDTNTSTSTSDTNTSTPAPFTITHNGTTYGIVTSPFTGRVWLDRNLGAARVCEQFDDSACFGDYYQWGRNFDGHQDSGSNTTPTAATDINNVGNSFILEQRLPPFSWTSTDSTGSQRSLNWSKTDGSSVCPVGFRVPTLTELKAETIDNDVTNRATAFSNFLKLPSAGARNSVDGVLVGTLGSSGQLWTSSVDGISSDLIFFNSSNAGADLSTHAMGLSVRCMKN